MDKSLLPFFGGLLGAFVAAPFVEIFKDRLVARRSWKNERRQIVETLRFVIANVEAFWEIKKACLGANYLPDHVHFYIEMLRDFDLDPLFKSVLKLSSLAPGTSDRSAAAQYLVTELLILLSLMRRMQLSGDLASEALKQQADEKRNDVRIFIGSLYANAMGIEGLSLILDEQINQFRNELSKFKMDRAMQEYERLAKVAADQTGK